MADSKWKGLSNIFGPRASEMDIQAGGLGLSTSDVVQEYLRTPGHVLAVLRYFHDETIEQLSERTQIPVEVLKAYESGQRQPALHHLTVLAKHWQGNLRVLLEALGHVARDAAPASMGLAADFDGDLQPDEKLDLRRLVDAFKNKKHSDK